LYYEKEFKVVERIKKQFKEVSRTIKKQEELINSQNMTIMELRDSNVKLRNKLNRHIDSSRIRKKYIQSPPTSPHASPDKVRSERASTDRIVSKKVLKTRGLKEQGFNTNNK